MSSVHLLWMYSIYLNLCLHYVSLFSQSSAVRRLFVHSAQNTITMQRTHHGRFESNVSKTYILYRPVLA